MKKLGLHIFHRDLRLEDNTALNELSKVVEEILPVFIFDDRQVEKHPYRSVPGLQILCESLEDLNKALEAKGAKLFVRKGLTEKIIEELVKEFKPEYISYNKDYTPFALKRDAEVNKICESKNVKVLALDDATLYAPGTVLNKSGKAYSVYTHYRLAVEALPIPEPVSLKQKTVFLSNHQSENLEKTIQQILPERKDWRVKGGRTVAWAMLKALENKKHYQAERDIPAVSGTSFLSAQIKFGTVSVREVYHQAKKNMPNAEIFLREILWHDFFTTVAALNPHVYHGAYRSEFDKINWSEDKDMFKKWQEGKTGFPIVDAGMRELKETGYMHNRVRMITASFLVKDLHINWRWGEKHFTEWLGDYDPAVNNGNWQWVAGTGCDASPWFRIFNPWLQQKKFDPDCLYIKKWLPELQNLDPKLIHDLNSDARESAGYPAPICDHKIEAEKTKKVFYVL